MNILLVFSLKVNLFLYANCQGYWSPWADCTTQEKRPCYRKRDLICNNGINEGTQCVQGQGVFEQFLTPSCNGSTCNPDFVENTTEWNTKIETEVCDGECYDAERTDRQSCAQMNSRRCQFIHVTRCYKEATCSGTWKTVESNCSASCGGGVKSSSTICVDAQTDQLSYNCNGTDYGKINQSIVNMNCNNQPCSPSWTPWKNNESCSVSCGGGIQKQSSMCIYYGSVSTLCDGEAINRLRYVFCNEVDCVSFFVPTTTNNCYVTTILAISIASVAVALIGIVAFLAWKLKSRTVSISNQSECIYENDDENCNKNEKANEKPYTEKSFKLLGDQLYETMDGTEVAKNQYINSYVIERNISKNEKAKERSSAELIEDQEYETMNEPEVEDQDKIHSF